MQDGSKVYEAKRSIRPGRYSANMEDYLEAILRLVNEKGAARVRDIADMMSVHKSTVTAALRRLSEEELLDYSPYELATLTPAGRRVAKDITNRHEIIEAFLKDVLLVEESLAAENACRMEHVLDNEVLERISAFAKFVRQCPRAGDDWLQHFHYYCEHGGKPPESDTELQQWLENHMNNFEDEDSTITLDKLKAGQSARIVKVGGTGATRRRITDMGVVRDTPVEVVKVAPLGDPIEVKVKGYNLSLRKKDAAAIVVDVKARQQ